MTSARVFFKSPPFLSPPFSPLCSAKDLCDELGLALHFLCFTAKVSFDPARKGREKIYYHYCHSTVLCSKARARFWCADTRGHELVMAHKMIMMSKPVLTVLKAIGARLPCKKGRINQHKGWAMPRSQQSVAVVKVASLPRSSTRARRLPLGFIEAPLVSFPLLMQSSERSY